MSAVLLSSVMMLAAVPGSDKVKDPVEEPKPLLPPSSGLYEAVGDGYKGLVILRQVKNVYVVHWIIGVNAQQGWGFWDGGRLVVSWSLEIAGTPCVGAGSWAVGEDGSLRGSWVTFPVGGKVSEEIWKPLKVKKQ